MSAPTETLTHALAWAARGFRVFPVRPGLKAPPVHNAWYDVATANAERIKELWGDTPYNIGVLTNDMIVIDVDVKPSAKYPEGAPGSKSFMALGLPLDTLIVKTPSKGRHVYYSGPNKQNSSNILGDGLDVRSFHGYVLAPGSWLDPDLPANKGIGGPYFVERDAPVRAAPPELIARLDEPRERSEQPPVVDLDLPQSLLAAARYAETDAPLAIEGAGGDHQTFVVAATLKDMGVSEAVAFDLLFEHWNDRCSPPWEPEALKVKVANAYAYSQNAPGSTSIAALLKGVDVSVFDVPLVEAPTTGMQWLRGGSGQKRTFTWLYRGILPTQGVAIMTAPSNAGKTFVGIALGNSLWTGDPFFGVTPKHKGGTLILSGEGFGSIGIRLDALGVTGAFPISAAYVGGLSARGAMAALKKGIMAERALMLETFGVPVRLIIFDTLSAAGLLEREDDNSEAAAAMGILSQWSAELDCLFLLNHHPAKKGTGTRGASAIYNSADYVLEISRANEKAAVRTLELIKSRDGETKELGSFTLLPVVVGQDDEGEEVVSCCVSTSDRPAPAMDRRGPHPQGALLIECVEWGLVDGGVKMADGSLGVEKSDLHDIFKDRWPLAKINSGISRGWRGALEWTQKIGALREVLHEDGHIYIVKTEIEES